tara:strand:+ start:3034 stop:3351 length:318 start_codon:yes stop_codon:yes gene_type:complete
MEMLLSREGFNVSTAPSGNQALAIFNEKSNIEVIVSDLLMPDGDGEFLLRSIKDENPDFDNFYFMTGEEREKEIQNLLESGAKKVLKKPFTPMDLVKILKKDLNF